MRPGAACGGRTRNLRLERPTSFRFLQRRLGPASHAPLGMPSEGDFGGSMPLPGRVTTPSHHRDHAGGLSGGSCDSLVDTGQPYAHGGLLALLSRGNPFDPHRFSGPESEPGESVSVRHRAQPGDDPTDRGRVSRSFPSSSATREVLAASQNPRASKRSEGLPVSCFARGTGYRTTAAMPPSPHRTPAGRIGTPGLSPRLDPATAARGSLLRRAWFFEAPATAFRCPLAGSIVERRLAGSVSVSRT